MAGLRALRFTDLLSWFVGESVGVRFPCRSNKKVKNLSPCFYTWYMHVHVSSGAHRTAAKVGTLNDMMAERFKTFYFTAPLPQEGRVPDWPHCGSCAAKFYMQGAGVAAGTASTGATASAVAVLPQPERQVPLVAALAELASLHSAGALTDDDFQAARAKLLG